MKRRERKMRGKKTLDSAGIRDNIVGLMSKSLIPYGMPYCFFIET